MDKIYLLDTNSMKLKGCNDWLKEVKKHNSIYDVKKNYLMGGLSETRKNIALLKGDDVFTVVHVIPEFEDFYEIASSVYENFMRPFDLYDKSLNSNGKTNQKLFVRILDNMVVLKNLLKESVYDASVHSSFNFMYWLVDKGIVEKHNEGVYSEADRRLVSTALARANEGLLTDVLSPDRGLSAIAEDSFLKLKNIRRRDVMDPYYLDDKTNFFNTYNGRIRLEFLSF